ncbi:hypothetical protein thsrh120_52040 [Rhizobium sp. No.120]
MDAAIANGGVLLQQHGVIAPDPVDSLGVDDRLIGDSPFAIEQRGSPPLAIGGPGVDEPAEG